MRIKDSEMRARKTQIVHHIAERTAQTEVLQISHSSLAADLGLTVSQTRCAMMQVVRQGLVRVEHRRSKSGAQVENAYQLTPYGRRCLKNGDVPK